MNSHSISKMGEEVEEEECVHLNKRLDWRNNTDAVNEKGQSRLDFLRNLRSFSVCSQMLHIFSKSVVERLVLSTVICWWSSIRASDLKKLNKLIKKTGSVLESLELILQRKILKNEEHHDLP